MGADCGAVDIPLRAILWNVDGISSTEREVRALIRRYRPDVMVLSGLKKIGPNSIQRVWTGPAVEVVPWWTKGIRSSPRAGVLVPILPGM